MRPFCLVSPIAKYGSQIDQASIAQSKANRDFAKSHGEVLQQIIDVTTSTAKWAESHRDEVAKALSAVTNIPLEIQTVAANRSSFAVGPITDDIIETQQGVADRFFKLGLIPKPVVVRDAVWKPVQA